jgi:photosystem II stability/assembly factor-like uncharacterized protein
MVGSPADGGESWHRVFTGLAWNPSFASATDGFAVAADRYNSYGSIGAGVDSGEVLATSDGGRTWHGDVELCNRSDDAAISYPTLAQAWVVCTSTPGGGSQYKTIFSSTDQGRGWQELTRTPGAESSRPPRPTRGYVQGLTFFDSGVGLLVVDDGPMYRTEDGGRTWQPLPLASFPDFPAHRKATNVNSAALTSATSAFALIASGDEEGQRQLVTTADGGQSWTAVHRWPVPGRRR